MRPGRDAPVGNRERHVVPDPVRGEAGDGYGPVVRRIGLVVVGVLLAACTAGPAAPAPPSGPTGGAPTSDAAPSTVALPPRPREVRLDGVDPCSLLTPELRAEQGLTEEPRGSTQYTGLYRGRVALCSVTGFGEPNVTAGLGLSTTAGVEVFDPRKPDASYTVIDVRGFPALLASLQRFPEFCTVAVDVADGQALDVQFADGGNQPRVPQAELCRRAQVVADAVMAELLRG
jgi:hypothetical protein